MNSSNKVLTTFQIPLLLKEEADKFSEKSHISVSNLVVEGLEEILKSRKSVKIPRLERGAQKLKYISILLPEELRDQTKEFAMQQHNNISFADVARHALRKVIKN